MTRVGIGSFFVVEWTKPLSETSSGFSSRHLSHSVHFLFFALFSQKFYRWSKISYLKPVHFPHKFRIQKNIKRYSEEKAISMKILFAHFSGLVGYRRKRKSLERAPDAMTSLGVKKLLSIYGPSRSE